MAIIIFSGENETSVLRGAAKFRDSLDACLELPEYREKPCTVLGPAPCPVPKINYHFRYRLTLNGEFGKEVRRLVAHLLRQFYADKGNRGVSVFVDCGGFTE